MSQKYFYYHLVKIIWSQFKTSCNQSFRFTCFFQSKELHFRKAKNKDIRDMELKTKVFYGVILYD